MLDTLKVGDKITVNAWGDFQSFSMTCTDITFLSRPWYIRSQV